MGYRVYGFSRLIRDSIVLYLKALKVRLRFHILSDLYLELVSIRAAKDCCW